MGSVAPVEAFIAVGSNIEPERNVLAAFDMLRESARVTAVSTMYRTAPMGRTGQSPFVNGVWRVLTQPVTRLREGAVAPLRRAEEARPDSTVDADLMPDSPGGRRAEAAPSRAVTHLGAREFKFQVLRRIEARLGRVRTEDAYAPRPIDLDIALFGRAVIREPDLVVPDPHILKRPFLAIALLELAPGLRLPGSEVLLAEQPVCADATGLEPMPDLTQRLREEMKR